MEHVFQFAIALGVLVVQYFISNRGPVFVGAVLPILYIGVFSYLYLTNFFIERSLENILISSIGGTFLLISAWVKGRHSLARKRQREYNKVKAMDL
ncbi:hypothetical protein [Paenibacillus polymyxa]|uniref:hypothetical protein n=1 Tax=Paenibacillus polymyxa TaxID=1406 RepID=UPI0023784534|nr:hypothetical protein [Paenibacillus polymyxa]WDM20787.1 hypothetical protein J4I02_17415 [Paenibacillus polymyxa]